MLQEHGAELPCVLIVDDEHTNRVLLENLVTRQGYRAVTACNGQQAVERFRKHVPHIVLMDIMMPVMDGYEATRQLKALSGERFVPVIFLTALSDDESLRRCVECGGDDFLIKPFNRVVLSAKLKSYSRLGRLYAAITAQKEELARHHDRLRREHELAERIFTGITDARQLERPNVKYHIAPMEIASGDVLLAADAPDGRQHYLLGDFVGHGLAAAIGAIPVADIFYSMTAKGFGIAEIVREANRKLYDKFPTDLFLAACLIEVDPRLGVGRIWNGGVPDVLLMPAGATAPVHFPSTHLPLGVQSCEELRVGLDEVAFGRGDRFYLYSDGLVEARNSSGEMFGDERLLAALTEPVGGPTETFDRVVRELDLFRGAAAQNDDIALVEISFDPAEPDATSGSCASGACAQYDVELSAHALRNFDGVQNLIGMVIGTDLIEHRTRLYVVLAELFNNALEHGLLGLHASMKETAEGFDQYYRERSAALAVLQRGWIRIRLRRGGNREHGRVVLTVQDSGPGFVQDPATTSLERNIMHSRRGIELVRSLCSELRFIGKGNVVEATYRW